jgi:uncharacterized membrane protein
MSLPCILWLTISIQLISVATMIAMHQLPHGRRRRVSQRVFFALMMAMGLVTMAAVGSAGNSWMTSGATLSVMTVCATLDLGESRRRTTGF